MASLFSQKRSLKNLGRSEEGQALVLTALALVVLMLMAGLGLDVAYLRYQKQQMQKAADAGAIAGASDLAYSGFGSATITTAGQADASANGFTDGVNGISVQVKNPPIDPPFNAGSNNENYVEVIVSQKQPTFFMGVRKALGVGDASVTVSARAVAGLFASSGCIYVLDPTAGDNNDLVVSGSGSLISNCGVYVDSPSSQGFVVSGSGCTTAPDINIVASAYSGNLGTGCPAQGIDPAPTEKIKSFKNPLSFVQAPTYNPATCITQGQNQTVFSAGCYNGGIKISGGTATFGSGTYIMLGGGLTIQGGATVTGTGVTFFNTGHGNQNYGDYRGFTISSGNSNVTLSAPTSAPAGDPTLLGVLFFEDPNIPWLNVGHDQTSQVTGGANTNLTGSLYLPTTKLTYSGGSSEVNYLQIVTYQLEISGPSTIQSPSGDNTGALRSATLAQ